MPTVTRLLLLLALACPCVRAQEPEPPQDPAKAIQAWVESDHEDRSLLDAATEAVLDAEEAGLQALATAMRATKPDQRQRRIGIESLVTNVVVGSLQRGVESGMRFAGQYDALRSLQPYSGRFLLTLVLDTPDWFPDDMRALVVPALRDVFPKGPEPHVLRSLQQVAEDVDFEAQPLREALSYALAQWGQRDLVQARIDELTENAGDGSDTDELHFVRQLAQVHYDLREYAEAAAFWRRYLAGMKKLDVPAAAIDLYNAACATSLAGLRDEALGLIERCAALVGEGRVDSTAEITPEMFETDPDLRGIRGTDRFEKAKATAFPKRSEDESPEKRR